MSMMNEGAPPPDEVGEVGEPAKQPQEAVSYRVGTPLKNCGLCEHFDGVPGKEPDGCAMVDGAISPFGYCDIYLQQPNPFGDQHQYKMRGDQIAPVGPPKPAPNLRIGNKTYE